MSPILARARVRGTELTIGWGALLNVLSIAVMAQTQVLFALPAGGSWVLISAATGIIHVLLTVLHELGHAVGRSRAGLRSKHIHVGFYSYEEGVAPREPHQDFIHSIGGPVADLMVAAAAGLAYLGARQLDLGSAATFLTGFTALPAGLALVELFPAFPLDGAQALRARLLQAGLSRVDATKRVARIGSVAAFATAVVGAAALALAGAGRLLLALWAIGGVATMALVYLYGKNERASQTCEAEPT